MGNDIQVNVRYQDEIAIIDLIGDVTSFAENAIMQAYREASDAGSGNILLNFRQNDYINSAGIAIIIGIVTETEKQSQQLLIAGLSEHFQKIFRMVGLTRYATIYPTEEAALAAL